MARRKSPAQKALANLPDALGTALERRDAILQRAGYTNERLAQVTKIVIEETLAAAQTATRQQPVVVGEGKGFSRVEMVTMPDEVLRQRCREFLSDLIGLQPSKASTVQVANTLTVNVIKLQPPTESELHARQAGFAKVIEVKPDA